MNQLKVTSLALKYLLAVFWTGASSLAARQLAVAAGGAQPGQERHRRAGDGEAVRGSGNQLRE